MPIQALSFSARKLQRQALQNQRRTRKNPLFLPTTLCHHFCLNTAFFSTRTASHLSQRCDGYFIKDTKSRHPLLFLSRRNAASHQYLSCCDDGCRDDEARVVTKRDGDGSAIHGNKNRKIKTKPTPSLRQHSPLRLTSKPWASWELCIGELTRFQQKYGHLRVPKSFPDKLHEFIQEQRVQYKRMLQGKRTSLSLQKIKELNDIGFVWSPQAEMWNIRYNELKQLYETEGTKKNVLKQKASLQLIQWTNHQRVMYRRLQMNQSTSMTEERVQKLNQINFVWDVSRAKWLAMFEELRTFCFTHGDGTFLSVKMSQASSRLRCWVTYHQRLYFSFLNGQPSTLTSMKLEKLKSIDFQYCRDSWQRNFEGWCCYKSNHSHLDKLDSQSRKYDVWAAAQNREYMKIQEGKPSSLTQEKQALLLQNGFVFRSKYHKWDKMFEEWKSFRDDNLFGKQQHHGLMSRPRKVSKELVQWIYRQRMNLQGQRKCSGGKSVFSERLEVLEKEGFSQMYQNQRDVKLASKTAQKMAHMRLLKWSQMFLKLKKYREKHGNCRVPGVGKRNTMLKAWVRDQSLSYANGTLSTEQIAELESIGFDFHHECESWNEMFKKMSEFYLEHTHCVIPSNNDALLILFKWAQEQRQNRSTLTQSQIDSLNKFEFVWDENEAIWKEMILALRSFRFKYGHCAVPQIYLPNPSLAVWVMHIRQQYEQLKHEEAAFLEEGQIEELENEGFIWDESAREWEIRYSELQHFLMANGHCSVPLWYPSVSKLRYSISYLRFQHENVR